MSSRRVKELRARAEGADLHLIESDAASGTTLGIWALRDKAAAILIAFGRRYYGESRITLGNTFRSPRFKRALTRAAVLLGIVLLVCVPTLTRVGQRLATSTSAPSFRNIDCPPKKLTIASATVAISPHPSEDTETVRVATFTPAAVALLPRSPFLSTPRPLRAPPSLLFA